MKGHGGRSGGAVERLPLTMGAFAGRLTLMGPAAVCGFSGQGQIIEAALAQGYWPIVVVLLAGIPLAAVYVACAAPGLLLTPRTPAPMPVAPRAGVERLCVGCGQRAASACVGWS
ncbi:MAG: hypothetical protein IPN06_19630 [Burkholderiales bacterium]|nr:hypothetical protein [Burkholderiales bacterium]